MSGWLFGSKNSKDNKKDKKDKNDEKKKDQGLFGIDWDGDGKVTELDDLLTVDILSDDQII